MFSVYLNVYFYVKIWVARLNTGRDYLYPKYQYKDYIFFNYFLVPRGILSQVLQVFVKKKKKSPKTYLTVVFARL